MSKPPVNTLVEKEDFIASFIFRGKFGDLLNSEA
jgi:hypothetical protein